MSNKGSKSSKYTHISEVLSGIVKNVRRESNSELSRIRAIWDQVVEPVISENAQPEALKNDILLIHATSSPIIHQLRFVTPQIIEQINRGMGHQRISQINYKVGRIDTENNQ